MEAHLILNGPNLENDWLKSKLTKKKHIFVTDGAYNSLKGINVSKVLGDLDSFNKKHKISTHLLSSQEHTDFEKSIQWIKAKGFDKLFIYNFDGNEFDHTIGNLYASSLADEIKICGFNSKCSWIIIKKEINLLNQLNNSISFIPLEDSEIESYSGVHYSFKKKMKVFKDVSLRNFISSSNMSLRIKNGKILVVISKYLNFLRKPHFAQ